MSLPTSLSAYRDCQELYDKAGEGSKGARAKLATEEQCIGLRTRLHYFRKLDREANAEIYPQGHSQHGQSPYDDYVVQIFADEDGDGWWLYITKRTAAWLALEVLNDDDGLIDGDAHEVHAIEDHSNG